MNKMILVIAITMLPTVVKCQSVFEGHVTYGTYLMSDFKSVLKNNQSVAGNNTEVVYNFPPYWGYEFGYKYKFKNVVYKFDMLMGMAISYNSTGGRLSAKDFSGEILQDMLVDVVAIGPNVRFIESGEKKWKMGFEFATLVGITNMTTKTSLTIGDLSDSEKLQNTYISTLVDTYWVTEYTLTDGINLVSRLGYQLDAGLVASYGNSTYSPYTGQRMHPDWTGLRGSIGMNYSF